MTIRKNDPSSPFWQAAEATSRRVDKFPRWKLGELSPEAKAARKPLPPESLVDALQDRVHRDPGCWRAAKTAPRRTAKELVRRFEEGRGVPLRELFALPKDEQREVVAGMARHARGGGSATLDERESEQVLRDVENVCSAEEARRRIRLARQRLSEMMIAEPEEHDQGATNMDSFRAGFHLPESF